MDGAARKRQRMLAIFLPVTAVLYISAGALSPKGFSYAYFISISVAPTAVPA